jgi:hypothetical protein
VAENGRKAKAVAFGKVAKKGRKVRVKVRL